MSQKNTLTIGGAGAGGVTALQVGQDLALLTVEALCALDGAGGCQVSLEIYEAGLRVAAVLWGVGVTLAAAAIGRAIAQFIERPSASV